MKIDIQTQNIFLFYFKDEKTRSKFTKILGKNSLMKWMTFYFMNRSVNFPGGRIQFTFLPQGHVYSFAF